MDRIVLWSKYGAVHNLFRQQPRYVTKSTALYFYETVDTIPKYIDKSGKIGKHILAKIPMYIPVRLLSFCRNSKFERSASVDHCSKCTLLLFVQELLLSFKRAGQSLAAPYFSWFLSQPTQCAHVSISLLFV